MRSKIEFYIAEVIDVFKDTYTDKYPDQLYSILVRTFNDVNTQQIYCRPADINIKKIPLVGEHVFIFKGVSQQSTNDTVVTAWYYLSTLPLQSSLNHNSLPTTTKQITENTNKIDINATNPKNSNENNIDNIELGKTFTERNDIPFLQPFEGDILVEGRFGNSIRFGSSHGKGNESGRYSQNQIISWDGRESRPLIILSNKKPKEGKTFSLENIQDDYSSLYLTSGQEIKTLKLSKELSKSNDFSGAEFIGSADRVILQSKTSSIVLDAATRVTLNANNIFLGSENGPKSPIPKGDVLEQILRFIISAIRAGAVGSGIYSRPIPPGLASLTSAELLIESLSSNRFWIDKNNNIG